MEESISVCLFVYFLFLSVHSGPRGRSIGLSGSQDPTCLSGLSQPANHSLPQSFSEPVSQSASQSAGLLFSLSPVEVNISSRDAWKNISLFSQCSQMSILVFHTARHFPVLSNRSASGSFQPMQKINDIIAT